MRPGWFKWRYLFFAGALAIGSWARWQGAELREEARNTVWYTSPGGQRFSLSKDWEEVTTASIALPAYLPGDTLPPVSQAWRDKEGRYFFIMREFSDDAAVRSDYWRGRIAAEWKPSKERKGDEYTSWVSSGTVPAPGGSVHIAVTSFPGDKSTWITTCTSPRPDDTECPSILKSIRREPPDSPP